MSASYRILILGASYGSLLATKLLMAGHNVHLVCLPAEASLINSEGAVVLLPVRGREGLIEVRSRNLPGTLMASGAEDIDPSAFDLIALAMQEPQYGAPGVHELLSKVARSGKPCVSIMNMPPLPYIWRILPRDTPGLENSYADPWVWQDFNPSLITLASPDPQAFRPPDKPVNVLQVGLPTNFKVAAFENPAHTAILTDLEAQIEAARFDLDGEEIALPVKLKVHSSPFVPLAKWAMLITGNYRCIQEGDPRPIRDAVHCEVEKSARIYNWVCEICIALGADATDMVPFEKYAKAAEGLMKPSSAARAVAAGAPNIERVDRLVQTLAKRQGKTLETLDETVALVDRKLAANRNG